MTPQKLLMKHLNPPSRWILTLVALGSFALCQQVQALDPNTPDPVSVGGSFNTADGTNALGSNTTGAGNSAFGWFSLFSNIAGSFNTGVGTGALLFNIQSSNTAVGAAALLSNTVGFQNTAVGTAALLSNTGGGGFAGSLNVAVGDHALTANTTGFENTAVGQNALQAVTSGTANANTALGHSAGFNATTGSGNVYIGANMLGVAGESNACYIRSIVGRTVDAGTAVAVFVDANNKLGTTASSRRFKRDIKPMDKASEAIMALKPVTFHYKSDTKSTPCFGLIAEEVAQVNPDLVVRNNDGELMSVRYDQVNAMLLNEFLKEHQTVQELKKQVAELTAGLQKVSAQLELNKSAPQTVLNNR
jgi:hypothetical protein